MEWKMNGRITIADLLTAKQERRPIAAVSCYDYTTARLVSQTPVDMILVGDSAAQLMLDSIPLSLRRWTSWSLSPPQFAAPPQTPILSQTCLFYLIILAWRKRFATQGAS
jgi:hypothetical protein